MPRSSDALTSTKCVGADEPATNTKRTPFHGSGPRVPPNTHLFAGVSHRVDCRETDVAVIGHVEPAAAPPLAVVQRDHHVGPVTTDREHEVAP